LKTKDYITLVAIANIGRGKILGMLGTVGVLDTPDGFDDPVAESGPRTTWVGGMRELASGQ
jgi:hypothetical protein